MNTPDPEATLSGTLALASDDEWDDATLATLHDDGTPPTAELVVVPGYTQTAWERQMVTWLRRAEDSEDHLWANVDKPDDLLVYDLLLMLGRPRAARAFMAGAVVDRATQVYAHPGEGLPPVDVVIEGEVRYAEVTPRPEPAVKAKTPARRRRPSQARKAAVNGGK